MEVCTAPALSAERGVQGLSYSGADACAIGLGMRGAAERAGCQYWAWHEQVRTC